MDIAIDDPDARFGAALRLPDFHVHRAFSIERVGRVGKGAGSALSAWAKSRVRRAHHRRYSRRFCPPYTSSPVFLEPRIGRERVLYHDLVTQRLRDPGWHGLVAVELPMWEIRRVQQYT